MTIKSSLFINALELELFLGWPSEERMRRQVVTLDIEIGYPSTPKACASDDLKDTVCYHELINHLRDKIGARKFHLIEHVTEEVFNIVKSILPANCTLSINLTKCPQIQGLGSVTFHYGE